MYLYISACTDLIDDFVCVYHSTTHVVLVQACFVVYYKKRNYDVELTLAPLDVGF